MDYPIYFTTPGTYTLWLRGYPANAAGDSLHVGLNGVITTVTGFGPGAWEWSSETTTSQPFTVAVTSAELYTVSLWLREDGLRIDQVALTTNTNYVPSGFLAETERLTEGEFLAQAQLTRTIVYTYDNLYRLTQAEYTTGESYQYGYDEVGNRLQQIIDGDTTEYLYDEANRLEAVTHLSVTQPYTFNANGNLLATGVMTNSFDAANRLITSNRDEVTVQPIYNGVGDRVGQTVGTTTTHFALDVQGLPEVIYTSEGNAYLHLPGVIVAESSTGETRYLLADGLGSVRQAVDENGAVVAYNEYDPFGNPVQEGSQPYGFTGEWWQEEIDLLHLRARWYLPGAGIFLSRDPVESEPPYQYVRGNVVNYIDPSGFCEGFGGLSPSAAMMMDYGCNEAGGPGSLYSSSGQSTIINTLGIGLAWGTGVVQEVGGAVADTTKSAVEEMIELANEAWENWRPEPEDQPTPTPPPPFPVPIPTDCPDEPDQDYIWRGIDQKNPKPKDFKPRAPVYADNGITIINPRDTGGLSFFEGRQNIWAATLSVEPRNRKAWRAGFTEAELIAAGFSTDYDGGQLDPWTEEFLPHGHVSIKRQSPDQWTEWLNANDNNHPYQTILANIAKIPGRVEANTAP